MKLLSNMAVVLTCLASLVRPATLTYQMDLKGQGQVAKEKKNEEILTPLTDAEQQLNPREILLGQPDFVADLELFVSEGVGAYSWAERIARKGNRYREESQFWIFVGEIGKTSVRIYSEGKVYDDMLPPRGASADGGLLNLRALALKSNVTFAALGTVLIDGRKCVKIEAVQEGNPNKTYLYAASDLKNLIIVAQVLAPKSEDVHSLRFVGSVERLRNISLDVADTLVEIPPGLKSIQHDKWTKVESAKVTYKNKPSMDFGVFRAPEGELFIWIRDAYYPWQYIYRPQEKTVEIAFQGLLVNRSGDYIWKTKENVAFSLPGYQRPSGSTVDTHVIVKPNSIRFRSGSYERDNAMIEVSW